MKKYKALYKGMYAHEALQEWHDKIERKVKSY